MHADGLTRLEPLGEIVALHHAGDVVFGGKLNHAARAQRVAPLAVVAHLGRVHVQHQANLLEVSLRIGVDLLAAQGRAGAVAPGGIANCGGEVADERNNGMTQILKLAHFVQDHGVTQMQIWRSGVHAEFDPQGHA